MIDVSEESMKDIIKLTLIISHFVLASCTSLPVGYEENPSYVLTDTSDTSAAKKAAEVLGDEPDKTVAYLINEGAEAFVARMAMLYEAERSIDVQYFMPIESQL